VCFLGVITFRFRLYICGWVSELGKKLERTLHHKRCVCVFCIKLFAGGKPPAKKERKLCSGAAHLLAPACLSSACLKLFLLGFLSLVR
jgi:hypothetical protein